MEKPKRPLVTGNEKIDEMMEENYQVSLSLYKRQCEEYKARLIKRIENIIPDMEDLHGKKVSFGMTIAISVIETFVD